MYKGQRATRQFFRYVGGLICGFLNMCALHVGAQTTFYMVAHTTLQENTTGSQGQLNAASQHGSLRHETVSSATSPTQVHCNPEVCTWDALLLI